MKKLYFKNMPSCTVFGFMLLMLVACNVEKPIANELANTTQIEAYFSTDGSSPQKEIIRLINSSKKSIKVACYVFTSKPISLALLEAHKRGVVIEVVADSRANKRYSAATFLHNNGIAVKLVSKYAIQHNKFMIFDDVVLQTGSYNYTYSAESKNAENIIITNDKRTVEKFVKQWNLLKQTR